MTNTTAYLPCQSRQLLAIIWIGLAFLLGLPSKLIAQPPSENYTIRLGTYKNISLSQFSKLNHLGNISAESTDKGSRIQLGHFESRPQADAALKKVRELGYTDAFVVTLPANNTIPTLPTPSKTSTTSDHFTIQIGVFSKADLSPFAPLADLGKLVSEKQGNTYRIMLGIFDKRETAETLLEQVKKRGYSTAYVRTLASWASTPNNNKTTATKPAVKSAEKNNTAKSNTNTNSNKTNANPSIQQSSVVPSTKYLKKTDFDAFNALFALQKPLNMPISPEAQSGGEGFAGNKIPSELLYLLNFTQNISTNEHEYFGTFRFALDGGYDAYLVRELDHRNGSHCIQLYVFSKSRKTFIDKLALSCAQPQAATLHQRSQAYFTLLNNDDFLDIVERIVLNSPENVQSDVMIGKIWQGGRFVHYPLSAQQEASWRDKLILP